MTHEWNLITPFPKYISKYVLVYSKCPPFIMHLPLVVTSIMKRQKIKNLALDKQQISGLH